MAGASGGTVRLWDVSTPTRAEQLSPLPGENTATRVAFQPGGRLLASLGNEGAAARLWDVSDPRRPRPVGTARTGSNPTR
ncbi:hypothetical protein [Streptomyces sp. NBC_01530]|uniref:hypothetical protein n=1 Tax=Streptomyces sp. NBC_01530 TaxID=2903895 RepID=UPI00386F2065